MDHRRAVELLHQAQLFMPSIVPDRVNGGYIAYSAMRELGRGATIFDAIQNARSLGNIPQAPPRRRYKGDKRDVILGEDEVVAVAKSRTYADRIANALNLYNPNERGI